MFTCVCGVTFANSGAYSRHKDSDKCLSRQDQNKGKQDIRTLFKNCCITKKQSKEENNDDQNKGKQPDKIENEDDIDIDEVYQHKGCRFVLVNDNNEIIEINNNKDIPECVGVIPHQLKRILKEEGECIGSYIPWTKLDKHRSFKVGETSIHHRDCCGPLIASSDGRCNDICKRFELEPNLNHLLMASFNTAPNAKDNDLNGYTAQRKIEAQRKTMARLRSSMQWKDRKLQNKLTRINIFKRIKTAMTMTKGDALGRIFKTYQKAGKSDQFLYHQIELYINDQYKPQNMEYDDFLRACLLICFSGSKLCDIMHRSGFVLSSSRTRQLMSKEFKASKTIITDAADMTKEKVEERLLNICDDAGILNEYKALSFKLDEMWTNEKMESKYNQNTKENTVILCQHYDPSIHPDKVVCTQEDCDRLIDELNDKDSIVPLHIPSMICLYQVTIHSETKIRTYIVATIPHCPYKSEHYTKRWLKDLAMVTIPNCLKVKTVSSDGCSEWRKATQQLCAISNTRINMGLSMVPQRVIGDDNGIILRGSDSRHNIKSNYKKISNPKGVHVVDTYITMAFIKKCGTLCEVWIDSRFIDTKTQFVDLLSAYKKDQMNVKNPLKYYDLLLIMTNDNNMKLLLRKLSDTEHSKLYSLKLYSAANSIYIGISLDRTLSWNDILKSVAQSATLTWVLFNNSKCKYMTSQNFYEQQKTCTMFYHFVYSLIEDPHFNRKLKLMADLLSSQSCELCFCSCRAIGQGSLTCLSALQCFQKVFIVDTIFDLKPDWRPPNKRLDGIERSNDQVGIANQLLVDEKGILVNIQRQYKHGMKDALKLIKDCKPDFYPQIKNLLDATTHNFHWLKTKDKDYEISEIKDDGDDDGDDDDNNEQKRSTSEEEEEYKIQTEVAQSMKIHWGVPTACIDLVSKTDKAESIQTQWGVMSIQRYLNIAYNEKRFKGDIRAQRSSDRLRALKGQTAHPNNPVLSGEIEQPIFNNDDELDVFAESEFMVFCANSKYYIGFAIEFYSIDSLGSTLYHDRLNQLQLNSNRVYANIIPVKVDRVDRDGNVHNISEFKLSKFDCKYKLNQTRIGSVNYIATLPIKNCIRINHIFVLNCIYFKVSELRRCRDILVAVPSVKDINMSPALSALDIGTALRQRSNESTGSTKSLTRRNDKLNKKAAEILNKKAAHEFDDVKRYIKNDKDSAPCTVCGAVIAAKDLLHHHSLHFVVKKHIIDENKEEKEDYDFALTITPKYKYIKKEDGSLAFETIPDHKIKPLSSTDCLFCTSSKCIHYIAPKKGKSCAYPVSNCMLFSSYGLKQRQTANTSNPSTNYPIKCPKYGEWRLKYLMELHLSEDHNSYYNSITREQILPPKKEWKMHSAKLAQCGKSKGCVSKKWRLIVTLPQPPQQSRTNTKKKASKKYGMKSSNKKKRKAIVIGDVENARTNKRIRRC